MNRFLEKVKKTIWFILIRLFNCFPIKENKIFLTSYYGSQYGDNPKYITEYILEHAPKNKFDLVWGFTDPEAREGIPGIRKVKRMSIGYFYELCTAKVVITNYRTTEFFVKRKNQYYIQTWHSSLRLKQIEKDAEASLPEGYLRMAKQDSKKCDLLLSGSAFSTDIFERSFWYSGEIFEHGTPRNDFLFRNNTEKRRDVLKQLNIPSDSKVVLYAPTFRKNKGLEVYDLQYQNILDRLKHRFGGDWICLVRLHPHLLAQSSQLQFASNVLDVTAYDDIQELLSVSDILISDYSSLMFDFSITNRPCFLYVPDLEEYIQTDRNLYFDLNELPFISVMNNEELVAEIDNFDPDQYTQDLQVFLQRIGTFENGDACEHLLSRIHRVCFKEKGRYEDEAV
ncbi:glycerophosphotransferase [Ammoniphilus oxalaticus]|uniref:Glycerophosphotransferase n=1 Tax=Ammoniphilus oxalaticus TaxID=66863 RepID=A0A419SH82_9BACL|nr:CDP-glycerol glycerophosphotransferase family protein [Ammoniphilus oxalaticus]RKD23171.1 glycerophosphotransferase [Ammoniphilus oxalaticus]